jgi:hypothetical protein
MAGGVAFIMCYMSDGLRISTRGAKRKVHAREASQEGPAGDDGAVLVPSEHRLAWGGSSEGGEVLDTGAEGCPRVFGGGKDKIFIGFLHSGREWVGRAE